jgi:hypothetical protein
MAGDGAAGGAKLNLVESRMSRQRMRKGPPCHESAGHRIIMQEGSVDVRGRPVTDLRGTAQKCKNV